MSLFFTTVLLMLQRLRESLALVLILLLPFHAFLITVVTKLILGPGHAPWAALAVWKEALLMFIVCLAIVEIIQWWVAGSQLPVAWKVDVIDCFILLALALGIFTVIRGWPVPVGQTLLGFKYDFLPLVAFLILRRVEWSDRFLRRIESALLISGGVIALYGIATFFLPMSFFTALGYSDAHSLYIPSGPLAAFQQIGGSSLRRIQSVMSGPNQLGVWLLVPLSVAFFACIERKNQGPRLRHRASDGQAKTKYQTNNLCSFSVLQSLLLGLLLVALALTFSRSAWIAAAVILGFGLFMRLDRRVFMKVIGLAAGMLLIASLMVVMWSPAVLLRIQSSRGHLERPIAAIRTIIEYPLGLGLGSAGPASNRGSDTCVSFSPTDDLSWTKNDPRLCVFVGTAQIQPVDRACNCPLLTENWYLQWGVEMGWAGLMLVLVLTVMVIIKLREQRFDDRAFLLLAFIGVSIAGLFLHAWEDGAVAYMMWLLIAAALAFRRVASE